MHGRGEKSYFATYYNMKKKAKDIIEIYTLHCYSASRRPQ